MKWKRKALSLLLCVVMLVSTCPQVVLAEYFQENGISTESAGDSAGEMSVPEESTEETPVPEESTEETPAPEESTEETPVPEESTEETPAPEESTEETPAPEESTEETPVPEEDTEEVPGTENRTEEGTETAPGTENGMEETPASDERAADVAVSGAQAALFLQEMAAGGSVTVSTPEQFEQALNNSSVSEIIVTKRITLCGTAESSDYSISPVMIRGNVTIKGNGSGILTLRSPIQLTGDNVTFQDIEMNFISSGALGSVPHREIFLAGHTLTLDNVSCYTKGSDGSLGGFGGDEAELLPTVYAGGYRNTTVQQNGAGLTIKNANDKTNIQAIYAGHDAGVDNKQPYTGTMNLAIDARTAVRDGIFASANAGAVNITVTGQNIESCRTKYFEGNSNTNLTFDHVSVNRIAVNGGNVILANGAIFEPVAKSQAALGAVEVPAGTTLNLASMPGTVIRGDFKGGGTLILDRDDALTVNGQISGDTTFKTWNGSLAGIGSLVDGKAYITSTSKNVTGSIALDANYGSNYALELSDGVWTAKNNTPSQDREFGSFEVLSSPAFADYDKVSEESLNSNIDPTFLFVTETKDKNGDVYVPDQEMFTWILRAGDVGQPDKTDWGTDIFVEELGNRLGDFEGKYYLYFGVDYTGGDAVVSSGAKPGNYQVFFTVNDHSAPGTTVGDIVNDAVASAEFTIYKNEGTASKEILDRHVSAIPDQKYTGKEIKPSVQVTVDGAVLTEGTDYILKYENHKNVTSAPSPAKVIVEGIGSYRGSVTRTFQIVKGETETKGALSVERPKDQGYTYGEIVKISFTAVPRQGAGKSRMARSAQPDTVDFYYGTTLLGSAPVVNGKATFLYDTTKRQIPVGSADITVDFGGNARLEPANFTETGLFDIHQKKLEPSDIAAISLKDFVYDGQTKETEITGITWSDPAASDLGVEGMAELASQNAGSYDKATITKLTFTGEGGDWYDHTPFAGNIPDVNVNPAVVIKKAESEGMLFRTLTVGSGENSVSIPFDQTIIPNGFEIATATEGDTSAYGQLITGVTVTTTGAAITLSNTEGEGVARILLTFKNHADVVLEIKVIKTSKQVVTPVFQIPDMEYTGAGYDAWSVEGYSRDQVTATYYDLDEGKDLGAAPPTRAGNYQITLRLDTGTVFAEETVKFTIEKKKTVLKALDREVKIGENPPNLDTPTEGVDYGFVSGKPNPGESIGVIKMVYAKTPDTAQTGIYEIQIGIVGNVNENYSVETRNGQLEVTAGTEQPKLYQITVTGGHANVQSAKAGETVTVTADVPAGREFVRWSTQSAGVVFADAGSAATTFAMPANDVEITAEYKTPGGPGGGESGGNTDENTGGGESGGNTDENTGGGESGGNTDENTGGGESGGNMGGNTGGGESGGNTGGNTGDGGQEGGNHTGGGNTGNTGNGGSNSAGGNPAGTGNGGEAPGQTTSPKTGEDGVACLWYIAMYVSFAGLVTLRLLRKYVR